MSQELTFEISKHYFSLDFEKKGYYTYESFKKLFEQEGYEIQDQEAFILKLEKFDTTAKGVLHFWEFILLVMEKEKIINATNLNTVYRLIDHE